ncbi:MAG: alpha/beta hydrolase [Sphingomonas sp.]|nr:alpha/beta hydrolase [Sphingomonas sp.]
MKLLLAAALVAANPLVLPATATAQDGAETIAPTRFSVEVVGEGPDVILIPGLLSPREVWDAQVEALKEQYRFHLVEVAGFGDTPAGPNAESEILPNLVAELADYIDRAELQSPAIIGHSMGGFTGLILSLDHPDKVGKLMIVDSLPFFSVLMGAQTPEAAEPQAAQMRDMMVANADAQMPAPDCSSPSMQAQGMSLSPEGACKVDLYTAKANRAVGGQLMYEIMTTDVRPRLAAASVPTTMLFPFAEPYPSQHMATRLYTEQYADHPAIDLVPVENSRHFIMFDRRELFTETVAKFLAP